jgi:hypothetical protein
MDSLDLSHVTVRSISNRQFSIPIKVETVENTEEITALIDSGAEGLFVTPCHKPFTQNTCFMHV